MEHVVREQAKAQREGRRVINQSVSIHTAICPECGKTYVSGGTTRTTTAAEPKQEQPARKGERFSAVA
jgi:ribosomal protein L32